MKLLFRGVSPLTLANLHAYPFLVVRTSLPLTYFSLHSIEPPRIFPTLLHRDRSSFKSNVASSRSAVYVSPRSHFVPVEFISARHSVTPVSWTFLFVSVSWPRLRGRRAMESWVKKGSNDREVCSGRERIPATRCECYGI